MNRLRAVAAVLLLFLAVVAGNTRADVPPTGAASPSPPRVTAGPADLGELLVPSRASTVTAGWVDPTSAKGRPFPQPAVVAAMAGLLVVLVAAIVRRRPGPPWHHRRRHSAVLRAPPVLLHP